MNTRRPTLQRSAFVREEESNKYNGLGSGGGFAVGERDAVNLVTLMEDDELMDGLLSVWRNDTARLSTWLRCATLY